MRTSRVFNKKKRADGTTPPASASASASADAPSAARGGAVERPPASSLRPAAPPRPKPQADPDEGYVAVGRVLGAFGLKGETKVQVLSDNPDRFEPKSRLYAGLQPVTVAAARFASGHAYVMFKGITDRAGAERLQGAMLQVPESDLPPLADGEYYRFQLIGLAVVDRDGVSLGTLDEIIETGANDVYRVRTPEGTDVLLAALGDVVLEIDIGAKLMVVDPPDWR